MILMTNSLKTEPDRLPKEVLREGEALYRWFRAGITTTLGQAGS